MGFNYYPYGLPMKHISYRSAGTMVNRYKYNAGNEYEDEGELNYSNTFYRKYDAQIGRFTGVDMLAEEFAYITPYQFGNDNPVMFNDPMGDKFGGKNGERLSQMNAHPMGAEFGWTYSFSEGAGGDHGGGGAGSGSAFGMNAFTQLWNSNFGGTWSSRGGVREFGSNAEAFLAGTSYLDRHNAWGQNGFANSFGDAQNNYIGEDADIIRNLNPTINVFGNIRNGQWNTSRVDYGMTFPSFSKLWKNYPKDVNGAHAHPSSDPYPNQCAIRVGSAFMKSGIKMSSYPKVNKTSDGYPRSSKNLADWTWQNFGKPKIMSPDVFEKDYKNSTGLMYIAPVRGGVGHIDLFNAGTTGSGYYLGSEIWFWPIK